MPDLDDIGRMTNGLRDNAKDVYDIWMHMPGRRADFGERELLDIKEAYLGLGVLLREMEKLKKREAA
jgi:hypothetical protein